MLADPRVVPWLGLLAIAGAVLYAVGDVLLLAARVDLEQHPNLRPHGKLLSGMERLVVQPWWRLKWGGLLGVLATPLLVGGVWHLHYGLAPAGAWAALTPVLLFAIGFILSPFVHGSFIYLGEYVQALDRLTGEAQAVVAGMLERHRQVLAISYGATALPILVASAWFSVVVALGDTRFPRWMAGVNPITVLLVYLVFRRLLPGLARHVEGAGFNLAFMVFFALTTAALW